MEEFNKASRNYLEDITKSRGDPIFKMEIMLDTSEMRPEQYKDADGW